MKRNVFIAAAIVFASSLILMNGCKKDDTTAPTVSMTGDNPATVVIGTSFTDPGATASDDQDGSLPATASGSVDVTTEGTYYINYSATDKAGNTGTAKRTVNVVIVRKTYLSNYSGKGKVDNTAHANYNTGIDSSSTNSDRIIIHNLGNFTNSNVFATVSGHEVTIPSQVFHDITLGDITVTGTGRMNNKGQVITISANLDAGFLPVPVLNDTLTKQ